MHLMFMTPKFLASIVPLHSAFAFIDNLFEMFVSADLMQEAGWKACDRTNHERNWGLLRRKGMISERAQMERAMGIENRDREQNRLGGEEILYRSAGGVCAAMALRSPWPRASISGSCRMPLCSSM